LLPGVGAALGVDATLVLAKVQQHVVAGDAAQPAAAGVPGPVAAEVAQADGGRGEDLLGDVLDVGAAEAAAGAPEMYQRRVQGHEALPGGRVVGAKPLQQAQRGDLAVAGTCWVRFRHARLFVWSGNSVTGDAFL